MPLCPNCDNSLTCIAALWLHLSLVHKAEKSSQFRCRERDCFRIFTNWNDFKRHLSNTHNFQAITNELSSVSAIPKVTNYEDYTSCKENNKDNSDNSDFIYENDISDLENFLNEVILKFLAKLYANHKLPRNFVQDVFLDIRELVFEMVACMKRNIRHEINKTNSNSITFAVVESVLDSFHEPFDRLSTEKRRFKAFRESGNFLPVENYIIGDRVDDVIQKGIMVKKIVPVQAQFLPMRNVLQKVFSLPGVFSKVQNYMQKLEHNDEVIENFVQGKLWKVKLKNYFQGKTVFPIFLYFDDFEICNPLGSHAGVHKLGAVYYQIACFPPEISSLLENIFLAALFHSNCRTEFRNSKVFRKVIDELNFLQTQGIDIDTEQGTKRVYFVLGLVLGDNLGLNSILGFVESFRANYYCRLCTLSRNDIQSAFIENNMRFKTYNADVELSNYQLTGIKERSVWNDISYFKSEENFVVDILHDGPEGYFGYIMILIVRYFVKDLLPKEDRLQLHLLNERLNLFDYSHNGLSNKVPVISEHELQGVKLKMSGSEIMNFVYIFTMLVGDLVPHEDPAWELYLSMRQIVDIIMCFEIDKPSIRLLKTLIAENLSLFKQVFPNENIKPKMHNFIHYPTVIEQSGPIVKLSSIRFEAKHKSKKTEANASSNRKNITQTLCIKEQLVLCYRLMSKKSLVVNDDIGVEECLDHISLDANFQLFRHFLPSEFCGPCIKLSWAKVNGIVYKPRLCVLIKLEGEDELLPVFGSVVHILQNETRAVGLVCKLLTTYGFDLNLHAYEVSWIEQFTFVSIDKLTSPFPVILVQMGSGLLYATVKHKI